MKNPRSSAGSHMEPTYFRPLRSALIVVNIILLLAAGYISVNVWKRQTALGEYQQYSVAFVASQGANEFLRFRQRLSDFVYIGTPEAAYEAELRYEIVLARLAMFASGDFAEFLRETAGRSLLMEKISIEVGRLEPMMADLQSREVARLALEVTEELEKDFIMLAAEANAYGAAYVAREQERLFGMHWTFSAVALGLGVFGSVVIALISWHSRQHTRASQKLAAQNTLFEAAMDNMSHGLCMFGPDGNLIVSNRRLDTLFNLVDDQVRPGMSVEAIVSAMHGAGVMDQTCAQDLKFKIRGLMADGVPATTTHSRTDGRTVMVAHQPMDGGGCTITIEDITERHEAQSKMTYMATHDALTKLPNRVLLHERLTTVFNRRDVNTDVAVFFLDLDNFKGINDTYGHPFGDELLKQVSARLLKECREGDTVARMGGDEFVIFLSGKIKKADLEDLARRVISSLGAPYTIFGTQVISGSSVGVAVMNAREGEPDSILKQADLALYEAKASGRGTFVFHTPTMSIQVERRSQIENDLLKGNFEELFVVNFQPITCLHTGRTESMEALLRWRTGQHPDVSPQEVVQIAEATGVIVDLGEWVLRTACRQAKMMAGISVAVNFSPIQFKRGGIVDTVKQALHDTGLPASRLEVEITETLLLQDSSKVIDDLHALKSLGVRISLDDFGIGYSSLSYLRKFPVDKIKIDKEFVAGIVENTESMEIVRTISSLARALGMKTVAEGVESQEQMEILKEIGCHQVQGFYYSRPMLEAAAQDYLRRNQPRNPNTSLEKVFSKGKAPLELVSAN